MRGGDQRTHVGLAVLRMIDAQVASRARASALDQPVGGGLTHGDRHRDRHAALARRSVGRA